jgi:hypothetical protein
MLGYNALSGLSEKIQIAIITLTGSPERAAYTNDGCSTSENNIIIGYIVIGPLYVRI